MADKNKDIKKKPTAAVKSLGSMKVTKSGKLLTVTSSWKYPSTAFDNKREDRFKGVLVRYDIDTSGVDDSVSTTKNLGKKNASIKGVSSQKGQSKVFECNGKGTTSKSWTRIDRSQFYPLRANDKDANKGTVKQARLYKLAKNPVWNAKKKVWTIPKKGTTVQWKSIADIKKQKYKSWTTLSKQAKTNMPKKGTLFYKSLTKKEETRTVVKGASKTRTRVDGIAVTVQGWNTKSANEPKYTAVKKPNKNPKQAGYYVSYTDKGKKKYKKTGDKKVVKGTTYYTQSKVHIFDNDVPKNIAYFNFKTPPNPEVKKSTGGQGTNHELTFTFKATPDKSNKYERWDTHYETYYTRGMKKSYTSMSFVKTKPTRIEAKNVTKTNFTVKLKPNDYLVKSRVNADGKTVNAYVLGLEEGEWLQLDLYYYDRGIAGPSVNVANNVYQGSDPTLAQMKHQSYLYAWPLEVTCNTPVREGQHYRIKFKKSEDLAKNEKRRTGKYTLQRLSNFRPDGDDVEKWSNAQWLTAAAASDGWKDIYSVGGDEREFSDNVRDAAFEPSHRTYYRVKSESQVDGLPHLYSDPVVVNGYAKIARADTDTAKIIEVSSCDDGRAMRVVVGFTRTATQFILVQDPPANPKEAGLWVRGTGKGAEVDGNKDHTSYVPTNDTRPYNNVQYYEKITDHPSLNSNGTEVTWSTYKYAWESNEKPSKIEILDTDKPPEPRLTAIDGGKNAAGQTIKATVSSQRMADYPVWAEDLTELRAGNSTTLMHFHSIYIRGLDLGVPYYFKARRFLKNTDTTVDDQYSTYAVYTDPLTKIVNAPVTPKSRPKKVKLSTDSVIEQGEAVELSWTYDDLGWTSSEYLSTQPQEMYTVYALTGTDIASRAVAQVLTDFGEVTDSTTHATIPYSSISKKIQRTSQGYALTGQLFFAVRVKVGGTWSDMSNVVGVTFVTQPTSSVTLASGTLTELPLKVTLKTNDQQASAVVRIVNVGGCSTWMPYGRDSQPDGAVVYSRKYNPAWKESSSQKGTYVADWSSEGLDIDFRDGGKYMFQFMASHEYAAVGKGGLNVNRNFDLYDQEYAAALAEQYDSEGLLKSASPVVWGTPMNYDTDADSYTFDMAQYDVNGIRVLTGKEFKVNWSRKAVAIPTYSGRGGYPAGNCILPPILTSSGVQFIIPKTWRNTDGTVSANDVVDMYRVTPDGAYLVRSDIPLGSTVIDTKPMYSNYANCRYRFATRTPEGGVEWVEIPSGKKGHCVRFDWGDEEAEDYGGYSHLELPYNLKWTDQWTKNARIQLHMDGSYSAYWRGGVDRKNTLSTELLKFEDPEQVERVKALARYTGPVFVRLPDGCAFCANVDVNSLENSYDKLTLTASFTAQEIGMIPQFAENTIKVN